MAVTKAIGVPRYLSLAWWFVDGPAGWLFLTIPTAWTAQTFWARAALPAIGFAVGGIATSATVATALSARLRRSMIA